MGEITLLNIDCMTYMATQPDNAFDLACVDPPYGIGMDGGRIGNSLFEKKEWDLDIPENLYFTELGRVSREQIIWGGNYFTDMLPPTKSWIYWDKRHKDMIVPKTYADGELAWTSFDIPLRVYRLLWDGAFKGVREMKMHPTQKPMKLYKWIMETYAKPEQRILDTHLGSGSSAIAAHYFGCDFVGCEIDEDYYKAALNRFNEETKQAAMF